MNNAMISLSFDDGRFDNKAVFDEILGPMEIPATFNITTGYVDGSCLDEFKPSSKPALSVDDVISLASSNLVEIALHGDQHLNTEEDVSSGRKKLISWLKYSDDVPFGFASPGSGKTAKEFLADKNDFWEHDISYLRISLRNTRFPWVRILCRKLGRILHFPFLYRVAYADTLMTNCTDRIIYSVPVMKTTTYAEVKAIVDLCVKRQCALTLMFHSITPVVANEDNWSWERSKFLQLCTYLKKYSEEGTLSLLTTKQLHIALQGAGK